MDRPRGIGGSDAAACIGLHPQETPVGAWLRMTGRTSAVVENEAMRWGSLLEPVVIAEAMEREDVIIEPNSQTFVEVGSDWRFCTPDGRIIPSSEFAIAEVKTVGLYQAPKWEDGIPLHVQVQMMHNMDVVGASQALVAALIGGQKLVTGWVEYDAETAAMIREREAEFWACVRLDTPPPLETASVADLGKLYPESKGGVCTLDDEPGLIEELRKRRVAAKAADALVDEIESRIKSRMGVCEVATVGGVKVASWKSHERRSLDSDEIRRLVPEVAAVVERVSVVRPFRVYA